MILKGAVFSQFQPIVPESLRKRIDLYYTCDLTKTEASSLTRVLNGLDKMLLEDHSIKPELWAHIIFIGDKTVNFEIKDCGGEFSPIIWLPVYNWRARNRTAEQIMLVMVEELCHCFWSIRNEVAVKAKVIEFMWIIGLDVSWPEGYQF